MGNFSLRVLDSKTDHAWGYHKGTWEPCQDCEIGKLARHHVFFRGVVPCDVLFIGEAPGQTEDVVGLPFVGRSGKMLDMWIGDASVAAVNKFPVKSLFTKSEQKIGELPIIFTYAITNTVLCRPTDRRGGPNRPPSLQEKANCKGRLHNFVAEIARPKLIVAVGKHAAMSVPKFPDVEEIYHPAYCLRQGGVGSVADLQMREKLKRIICERIEPWFASHRVPVN